MSEKALEFTTRLTREDVAGVIEALVEGLKDGRLKIHKSDEAIELDVPRVIDLEVEAKVSEERAKFEIEVSWRTNRAENPDLPDDCPPDGTDRVHGSRAVFSAKAAPESAEQRTDAGRVRPGGGRAVKKPAAGGGIRKTARSPVRSSTRKSRTPAKE